MPRQSTKKGNTAIEKPVETIEIKETSEEKLEEKPAQTMLTLEQAQKMIEEALKKQREELEKKPMTATSSDEFVTMIFQAEVNDGNTIPLGPNGKYGQITGKKATITIQKRDFMGDFRDQTVQGLLNSRNLIVVDGLTDEERKIYGLNYEKGEYLEPAVYDRILEMGDDILNVFPKLCAPWRKMVAVKCAEAFENKTLNLSRDTLAKLNAISKKEFAGMPKDDERRKGAFYQIIHAMNAEEENAGDE